MVNTGSVARAQPSGHEHAPMSGDPAAPDVAGQLAGGVAHDFNNVLTAILGFVDLLSMRSDLAADAREDVEEIGKAGRVGAALAHRLHAFSRRCHGEPKVIDLNLIISGLAPRLRRLLGERIILDLALASGLHPVFADPTQIEQAIVELSLNAGDAIRSSGQVRIVTGNVLLEDGHAAPDRAAGPHVMVAISDTGTGMDAAAAAKLLAPAFTAGSHGKAISLGLHTVRGIVETSHGSIGLRSAPGQGSTFTIWLPVSAGADPAAAR